MKQFDLKEYLANPSRKVVTRDSRKARIICTDADMDYPIIALVECTHSTGERVVSFSKEGLYLRNDVCIDDLFFAPEKHKGWINIYRNDDEDYYKGKIIYSSKEDAIERGEKTPGYITTTKIEWEE